MRCSQGLINLLSDRKHKSNLGAPHILTKLRRWGEEGDFINTIEKTNSMLRILSETKAKLDQTQLLTIKEIAIDRFRPWCDIPLL